jgi:hypothetical protein
MSARRAPALAAAVLAILAALGGRAAPARAAAPAASVEDLCKAVVEDANYKVRVQAALVLGRLGDSAAIPALTKALGDANKTVRGIAAQALGQLGDPAAADALRGVLKQESDPFVRKETEKALASLERGGGKKGAKIYLSFGPFSSGVKSAGPEAARVLHDALARELGKLPVVTMSLAPADQKNFARSGMVGFYIDGNITRLDDVPAGGASETSCDVRVMVARWPSKSIILWTNAGASLGSGPRPRDKENARNDCLQASAEQLAEDLGKFLKAQGG